MFLLKYLTLAIVLALILGYTPGITLTNENVVKLGIVIFFAVLLINLIFTRSEHMTPNPYFYAPVDERLLDDYANTGLKYENDLPYQYVIGPDKKGTVDYNKAPELMNRSVINDLYNQHNFNIIWSPHTHVGKGRAYLNWKDQNEWKSQF